MRRVKCAWLYFGARHVKFAKRKSGKRLWKLNLQIGKCWRYDPRADIFAGSLGVLVVAAPVTAVSLEALIYADAAAAADTRVAIRSQPVAKNQKATERSLPIIAIGLNSTFDPLLSPTAPKGFEARAIRPKARNSSEFDLATVADVDIADVDQTVGAIGSVSPAPLKTTFSAPYDGAHGESSSAVPEGDIASAATESVDAADVFAAPTENLKRPVSSRNIFEDEDDFEFSASFDRNDPIRAEPAHAWWSERDQRSFNDVSRAHTDDWRRKFKFDSGVNVGEQFSLEFTGAFQDSFDAYTLNLAPFRTPYSFDYEESTKGDLAFRAKAFSDRFEYRAGFAWSESRLREKSRSDVSGVASDDRDEYAGDAQWHHASVKLLDWKGGNLSTYVLYSQVDKYFRGFSASKKPSQLRAGTRTEQGVTYQGKKLQLKVATWSENNFRRKSDKLNINLNYELLSVSFTQANSLIRPFSRFLTAETQDFDRRNSYRYLELDIPIADLFGNSGAKKNFLGELVPASLLIWGSTGKTSYLQDVHSRPDDDLSIGGFLVWQSARSGTTIGYMYDRTDSHALSLETADFSDWSFDFSQNFRGDNWKVGGSFGVGTFQYAEIGNQFDDRFMRMRVGAAFTPKNYPHVELSARLGRSVTEYVDFNEVDRAGKFQISVDVDLTHLAFQGQLEKKKLSLFYRSELGQSPFAYRRTTGDEQHVVGFQFAHPL
jgi:hypothetical protein